MAHQLQTAAGRQIIDIRHLLAGDLDALLREQGVEWKLELDWDFSKSASLVRQFVAARTLSGVALLESGEVTGYGYTGLEDHKGSIWDVYVRRNCRYGQAEKALFRVLLDGLIHNPGVRRIESQMMLMDAAAGALQGERALLVFERLLMKTDAAIALPPGRPPSFRIEPWSDEHGDAAATALWLAYTGHIDAEINDHYRTLAGARRFLHDLVQFPGCATFYPPGSYVAFDSASGGIAGMSLASFIADDVAHIAEICVVPKATGLGLGYEMLRRSLETLRLAGAKRVSLTVTADNEAALRLYRRCGFREMRRFYAYVWEG